MVYEEKITVPHLFEIYANFDDVIKRRFMMKPDGTVNQEKVMREGERFADQKALVMWNAIKKSMKERGIPVTLIEASSRDGKMIVDDSGKHIKASFEFKICVAYKVTVPRSRKHAKLTDLMDLEVNA